MQRHKVRITFPEHRIFSTELQIRVEDLNYGGHLSNEKLLSYAHETRVRFLGQHGLKELDIEGVGLIMADAMVRYVSQGHLNEMVRADLYVGTTSEHSFDLYYRFVREMHRAGSTSSETKYDIAQVKTGMACFDYSQNKIARIPLALKQALMA